MSGINLVTFITVCILFVLVFVLISRAEAALRVAESELNYSKGLREGRALHIKTGGHLGDSKSPETRANAGGDGGLPKGDA
ncbi:hypothetical protein ACMHYJ_05325 [Castellaniella hirudinis]|uniref:hypothetical protein n=1 Tax=Castellaniella hirudinis TaxID=1144617 RepID=UPI0039C21817